MMILIAFALFAILVVAWMTAPAASAGARELDPAGSPVLPELGPHAA